MTGSSTFQIFPRTTIDGDTMTNITPENEINEICTNQCKCLCESTDGCVAFTTDKKKKKNCRLKSNVAVTRRNVSQDTYVKGARGYYIIFWIILFLVALAIFLTASMSYNINNHTAFYTENFA